MQAQTCPLLPFKILSHQLRTVSLYQGHFGGCPATSQNPLFPLLPTTQKQRRPGQQRHHHQHQPAEAEERW